jgi:hypothetical protein
MLGALACVLSWQADLFRVDVMVTLAFCGLLSFGALGGALRRLTQWRTTRSLPAGPNLTDEIVLLCTAGLTASLGVAGLALMAYGLILPVMT